MCKTNKFRLWCVKIGHCGMRHALWYFRQRTLTYFIRRRITARLTSCLTSLDSTKQVNMSLIQHKQSRWIQTKQRRGRKSYIVTFPFKLRSRLYNIGHKCISVLFCWQIERFPWAIGARLGLEGMESMFRINLTRFAGFANPRKSLKYTNFDPNGILERNEAL